MPAQGELQLVGQTLGRYQILKKIGEGGMGVVYLAHDERLDREVALKVLPPGVLTDESVRNRFRKEALALAKLNHPNIATIHDFDTQSEIDFLVTEFIPGKTLSDMLLERPLAQEEIVRLGIQLCEGLAAAHEHNVVHRDLKPSNLRVTSEGRLKILDFGLARLLRPAGDADLTQSMSDTRSFAGTIPYMSPEQLRGEQADPRNDIYAAGVVLYEMACGRRPFPQTQSAELIAAILNSTPLSPSSINHSISTDFDAVVLKAIAKQPAKRYQSASAIVPDLEQLGLPRQASRIPTRVTGMWRWVAALICIAVILTSARFWGHGVLHWPRARASYVAPMFPGAPPQEKYLAVLPFKISGDDAPVREYLSDGLSNALYARLLGLKDLRLASQTATAKASEGDSVEKTARKLGVNHIVQGTIKADFGKLTVTVNLVDPTNTKRTWTQQFMESPKDLLALEDQIATQLVAALQINPSKNELAQIAERPTNNADAYLLYLRGRQALRGSEGSESAQSAIDFFERGIHEDSNFALAYAGLADANLMLYGTKKESRWSRKALDAAKRAVQINDSLPAAHIALANVYSKIGKKTEAIAELKRAVELGSYFEDGYLLLGNAYLDAGQKDEAIATYKKAIEVNPYYWSNHIALGNAYYSIGQTEKALEEYKRVTELEPENVAGWDNLGNAYLRLSRYEESIPMYKKSIELSPNWSAYNNLGYVYLILKRYGEAVQMSEKAVELAPNQELAVGNLADAYRGAGQKDKANATYDKAIALALLELKKNPHDAFVLEDLALYNAKMGAGVRGLEYIRRARSINKSDIELIYAQALVENLANRRTDAVRTFREAVEKGYPIKQMGDDPELAALHNSPEFEELWNEYYHKSK